MAYKKLRVLVDSGCIFIGHGLAKDFRIISGFISNLHRQSSLITPATDIFVPPEQVIDTVDVYHLQARQRKLSLRFLSWAILKQHIQTDTHDSIEDARSALLLYKMFQEYEEQGIFDEKLEELYRIGKQYVSVALSEENSKLIGLTRTGNHPRLLELSNPHLYSHNNKQCYRHSCNTSLVNRICSRRSCYLHKHITPSYNNNSDNILTTSNYKVTAGA